MKERNEVMKRLLQRLLSVRYMLRPGQTQEDDISSREVYRTYIKIAWASVVEAVLVSMIGSVDTIMVGVLGKEAIAAVGITTQPRFIVLAVILSLNVGVTAVVARRRGQSDPEGANSCMRQALMISGGISLLLSLLAYIFARDFLLLAGAQSDTIDAAVDYFKIMLMGTPLYCLGLTINAAQRGCGRTAISMTTNVAANLVNVVFDYLLIGGNFGFPALGVKGDAIATVAGYAVAFFMSVYSITARDGFLHLSFKSRWRFDKATVGSLANVGSSALIEQVFMRIGFFVYSMLVAGLGTTAYSTHQICMNILNLSFSFGDGLAVAGAALVGRSLGEKKPGMAMIYGKTAQRIAFAVSTALFVFFIVGRRFMVRIFIDDPEIIAMGATLMIIMAFTTHFQTSQVVYTGCLRGAGDTKFVAVTSMISIAMVRPLLSWLLCYPLGLGLIGAWLSLLLDQSMRFSLNFFRFQSAKWTQKVL